MSTSIHKVKIVAPYNANNTRYQQIRTFLSWKDSIASQINTYALSCYFQDDGLIAETNNQYNYNQLLMIDNAQPYNL